MARFVDPNQLTWDTVEIPLAAGVDLRSPNRTVAAPAMLAAENLRYDSGTALRKRRGHRGYRVRSLSRLDLDQAGVFYPASWLFGMGVANDGDDIGRSSPGPDAGFLAGMAKRDTEVLAWDGWRMFSWPGNVEAGGGWQSTDISAVMPHAHTSPIAKGSTAQYQADAGETDKLRVVAWIHQGVIVYVSVYDTVTLSPYITNIEINSIGVTGPGGPATAIPSDPANNVRVVPCGDWVHVVATYDDDSFSVMSFHPSNPAQPIQTSSGECNGIFDVRKISEESWLFARVDTAGDIKVTRYNANGSESEVQSVDFSGYFTAFPGAARVAINQHPATGELCVAYISSADPEVAQAVITDYSATNPSTELTLATPPSGYDELTVAAQADTVSPSGESLFDIFISYGATTVEPATDKFTVWREGGDPSLAKRRYFTRLCSHAYTVGQAVQVHLYRETYEGDSKFQYSRFICDTDLRPVGRLEYGTSPVRYANGLVSVHFSSGQSGRNYTRFHGILVYRTRVDSADNDQYDEESLKWMTLDYLPKLRSAQLGRCTYFAGAQAHCYDGQTVTEAGFHLFPENIDVTAGAAGNPNGDYIYRVRWAWKNAQGEEVVSAATFTQTFSATSDKIVLGIPSLGMTRKDGVYALVYRNEASGTAWYLVSSRDPLASGDNGYVANEDTTLIMSFTDNLSDADLISREVDTIGNAGGLERFSPPACEVIAAGRDRLWVAGGELPAGDILPSLSFEAGRAVHFDQRLQTTIDRDARPITAIGFLGNSTLVFKPDRIYAFEADGPNNLGIGSFDVPRVITTDAGAQSQEGLVLVENGLFFQGLGNIQMLGFNYQVMDPGLTVPDSGAMTISGAFLAPADHEVRFYSATDDYPTLVYNLHYKQWTTWTGLTCAGAVVGPGYKACLGRLDGRLWVETDDHWTDAGRGYRAKWRTAWLHAEHLQAFQRVRKVALLGDLYGTHRLRLRAFYDDRTYPESVCYWDASDDFNDDTWGANTWGAGVWGDTEGTETQGLNEVVIRARPRDRVYQFRYGLQRQKCSRISIEIDDGGAHSEGPSLTALALEFGRRGGLSRVPARSLT